MTLKKDRSRAEFSRACRTIPGGVNSPARAFGAVGGSPLFIERAQGQFLYDIDGNELLDFVGSWGPHILGHRHPSVISAVRSALDDGTSYGAPTALESELAELIVESVPSIEKVRMVNSGTEATMSALRVARGFTNRSEIIKFAGCYHGHVDSLLVKAGSGALTHGVPSSPGVPAGATADTIILEYNDIEGLDKTFRERGAQIAAVILEPVVGNMGVVLPAAGFLQACRDACTRHGALLIFDEVMTGFRVAYGGAQSLFGIKPDLTTLGKIIGGGMPVGAYGGRSDVMDVVSPVGPVYQAGTLSGNPLAMACGLATLRTLRELNPYDALATETQQLVNGISAAAQASGLPHQTAQCGSMFTLFFTDQRVKNLMSAMTCNTARFAHYFQEMLDRRIYLPCSQFEANFVSMAHTQPDLDRTIAAASEAFAAVAAAG